MTGCIFLLFLSWKKTVYLQTAPHHVSLPEPGPGVGSGLPQGFRALMGSESAFLGQGFQTREDWCPTRVSHQALAYSPHAGLAAMSIMLYKDSHREVQVVPPQNEMEPQAETEHPQAPAFPFQLWLET